MFQQERRFFRSASLALLSFVLICLNGCQTASYNTQQSPFVVGPGAQPTLGAGNKVYAKNAGPYLDVAVPVFNPGLPKLKGGGLDYKAVNDKGIWPQLRRSEAKRFAVQTKKSLENIGAFGAVSVVPTPSASADLYLLGAIDHSDSEVVRITATVMDSAGHIWGTKQFEHEVSVGFFRDALNKEKDPYEPVFKQIGDYVYDLLNKKTAVEKQALKDMTKIRYALHYSPEAYGQYVQSKVVNDRTFGKHTEFTLTGLPSKNDRMMRRISALGNQEQMFIDRLQDQYLAFDADTEEPYRSWQKETLPEAIAAREAKGKRNVGAALATALAVTGLILHDNSNSRAGGIGAIAAAAGAVFVAKGAFENSGKMKVHKESIDEMGENLDITLSPSVMKFDDKTVELTGTASEQYEQWKAHLHKIYQLESGNGRVL